MTEDDHLLAIERSFKAAERMLAMEDVVDEDEDPDTFWSEHEARFHCEVCTVREVLIVVWPEVEKYIDWLKAQIPAVQS